MELQADRPPSGRPHARSGARFDTSVIGSPSDGVARAPAALDLGVAAARPMQPTMDETQRAGDDERVASAVADLRRALEAADSDDRAFILGCLEDLARRFDDSST
jgi:hypothetical protein